MKRSFHSPLSLMMRDAHSACAEAALTGAPLDEVVAWRSAMPRRAVLAGTVASFAARPAKAAFKPSVVIVGAGLAGLLCARTLWRERGIAAPIYEWNTRIGGRVDTLRGFFAGGITAEMHGQFISSEHTLMRALAAEFGLTLANDNIHLGPVTQDSGIYHGQTYTPGELNADWQAFGYKLFRAAVQLAPSATYLHASKWARQWDNLSVVDWVDRYVPGGTASKFGGFCLADVVSEYGSPPDQQSALNLLYILGFDASTKSGFQSPDNLVPAGTDEKYCVLGGNDQIIAGLASGLPADSIKLGYQLLAVRETAGRQLVSTFQAGSAAIEVTSDHVVIAVPPTTLRDVDLSGITLSPVQQRAIAGATLGNNAKIFLQFAGRPWIGDGLSGNVLTGQEVCGGWDASNTQQAGLGPHAQGVWVGFPGATFGADLAARYGIAFGDYARPAPAAMAAATLVQLDANFSGSISAFAAGPHLAYMRDGNIDPYLRGAYSNFLVGQYTSFCGAQSLPAGNVHFAGEHTSVEFQGYMEGGARSGVRAAREI